MSLFKRIIKKYKMVKINSSQHNKTNYLRKLGVEIGNGTIVLNQISGFGSEPYLISIGDNCLISGEVAFITHDGGMNVINNLDYFNEKMDKIRRVKVGNNCFIGERSIILPGVTIGNNCIIGAGSIVTKNVKDRTCVAGVPAKEICTIDEYVEKNKQYFYPTYEMNDSEKKEYLMNIKV